MGGSVLTPLCPQLSEALQASTQIQAELSLQQKLREDSELRLEEMEDSLLEKDQELQGQLLLINRLQGEVRRRTRAAASPEGGGHG